MVVTDDLDDLDGLIGQLREAGAGFRARFPKPVRAGRSCWWILRGMSWSCSSTRKSRGGRGAGAGRAR